MFGVLLRREHVDELRFERVYPCSVEKLWAALTIPERIADWLCATADVELRVGGRFWLAFQNSDHSMKGEVTRIEPPTLLEYTWPEAAAHGSSLVLWEVFAEGDGARLVLTHTLNAGGDALDFLSGWHWHLDALGPAAAEGSARAWSLAEWQALRRAYEERAAPAPVG